MGRVIPFALTVDVASITKAIAAFNIEAGLFAVIGSKEGTNEGMVRVGDLGAVVGSDFTRTDGLLLALLDEDEDDDADERVGEVDPVLGWLTVEE
jgi:hypothetical protein